MRSPAVIEGPVIYLYSSRFREADGAAKPSTPALELLSGQHFPKTCRSPAFSRISPDAENLDRRKTGLNSKNRVEFKCLNFFATNSAGAS